MNHLERYISRLKPEYLSTPYPDDFSADILIVIPCYDEKNLFVTLRSLLACSEHPEAKVGVAIIFNSSVRSTSEGILQNRVSYKETVDFARENNTESFRFFPLIFENLPRKHAGVGLARKIGMDLAVDHFLKNETENGIIVSLDADCTVSTNFISNIYSVFRGSENLNATIHNFKHRVEEEDPEIEKAIRQYEAYIHYFRDSLHRIGFPYYYHTIGSAFAVSADAYVRVGGMGRQQGGEDFYFLQKVFALGNVEELEDVFVYPMARFSDRVPFGTGPALQKIMDEPCGEMKVYSRQSLNELAKLFDIKDGFFKQEISKIEHEISLLHPSLVKFIYETDFIAQIDDCNKNSATLETFQKRFFHHFNAFRIIKYLNFAHPDYFQMEKISEVYG